MCMKCHIWPFQTSLGKMFLLCMQNLSIAHHQKTTQCSISISKHKGKMPVKTWKKSCTCVWKSIRQGMEAWVTESGGSKWKGWLWWCCHVFWTWYGIKLGQNCTVFGHKAAPLSAGLSVCLLFNMHMHIGAFGLGCLLAWIQKARGRRAHKSLFVGRRRSEGGQEG